VSLTTIIDTCMGAAYILSALTRLLFHPHPRRIWQPSSYKDLMAHGLVS
jgi:hypothetical protein